MKHKAAINKANKRSQETGKEYMVVYEPDYYHHGYHVATEYDLETFWFGATVVYSSDERF